MEKFQNSILFLITFLLCLVNDYQAIAKKNNWSGYISIPVAGNSWSSSNSESSAEIVSKSGIANWTDHRVKILTYFRTGRSGKINLAVSAKVLSGKSLITFTVGEEHKKLLVTGTKFDTLKIGTFNLKEAGYQTLVIEGEEKSSESYAEVSAILVEGDAADGNLRYVKDDFYWGRRGPSVHLNYEIPSEAGDVDYFYNELTIPSGNDVIGSYFMANGFAEGYFGIQVNSASERRILFSVWSPFKTDKPSEIPEDQKITLLKRGTDVYAGTFGNEGSGGQSYRKYLWKAATTYRFLLKAAPSINNSTDYTAWFFAPEINHWELIASFRRPKTDTFVKRPHSFLENFIPENGNITRMGYYSNQWVHSVGGKWTELVKAKFTADATARKDARLDYSGGIIDNQFYLKNCGFFSENVKIDSWFTKTAKSALPEININELP